MQRLRPRRALEHPAELDELPGGGIRCERPDEFAPVERQTEERGKAHELALDGAKHLLLALAARDVRICGIELVLPDARVDLGAPAVHVLTPFREPPTLPRLAPLDAVRAVERVREDSFG